MNNKQTIKKILIGLLIAIILLIVYSVLNSRSGSNFVQQGGLSSIINSPVSGQIAEADSAVVNAEILRILGSIENIELHDDIFINPVFRKLKDTNFAIPRPSRVGRKNPFLSIGFDEINNLQTSQFENSNNTEGIVSRDNNDFFSDLNESLDKN